MFSGVSPLLNEGGDIIRCLPYLPMLTDLSIYAIMVRQVDWYTFRGITFLLSVLSPLSLIGDILFFIS